MDRLTTAIHPALTRDGPAPIDPCASLPRLSVRRRSKRSPVLEWMAFAKIRRAGRYGSGRIFKTGCLKPLGHPSSIGDQQVHAKISCDTAVELPPISYHAGLSPASARWRCGGISSAFDSSSPCRLIGGSLRADIPDAPAQPAMRRIGVQARMPQQRDRDLRHGDRNGETVHSAAQARSVPFGNGGDQVGDPGECQRC